MKDKTVKELLTEPFRVQKKQGYYGVDTFRQGLLKLVYEGDRSAKSTISGLDCDIAMDKLSSAADSAMDAGSDYAFHTLLTLSEALAFFRYGGMIRYLDAGLCEVLSHTTIPESIVLSSNLCFRSLLLITPRCAMPHFLLFRVIDGVGVTFSQFVYRGDGFSIRHQAGLQFNTPTDTLIGECKNAPSEIKRCVYLVFNFLLWQQSMRDRGESVILMDAPTKQMGFGKTSKKLIVPQVIGEGYKPKVIRNYEPIGTHASPRTHWRSGHWKQQMIGSRKKPQHKTIWIEPTLVNA